MQKIHITLESDQNVWFTSDLHFGHRNMINFCDRPFSNITEMNEALISNWNNTVGDNDIVFVLGDTFWFNDSRVIKKVLAQLKGKEIYLIPGNHDAFDAYYRVDDSRIKLCDDICVAFITKISNFTREIWLSHYPMMTWPHRSNGAYQLFGHIHSKEGKTGFDQDLPLHKNQMDVGCDHWNYKPISLNKIDNILSDYVLS